MVARPYASQFDSGPSIDVHGVRLPAALEAVAQTIEDSRSFLELGDDWDGDGTPGFAEQTWRRAADFLARSAAQLLERHGIVTDHVEILPASEGALGIDWRTPNRELLLTVPMDPSADALFYGDDGTGKRKIKGTLDTSAPNRWLAE